jgi:glyoxylase-like metal-dependent hydrolase (beta-lactamase superfamily II)/rhodanese-related sulfurtransferase
MKSAEFFRDLHDFTYVNVFLMYIEQLYTNCLAEAAYYIESDGEAAIIDPLRETDPYIELAKSRHATIKYVFETHFHADFVSGHIDLSRKVNAPIVYGPNAETQYKVYNAKDGEAFALGRLKIRVLHTPGHTPESSCFLLLDENDTPKAVFTGDTLFVGDVGRPDLLDGIMSREELAGMLYESLNSKIKTLPDDVIVYPAHGPGSACGKNIGKETFSTIGEQKKFNYALQDMTRDEFIFKVTDGILPPPQYFFEDARINKNGYSPLEHIIKQNTKGLSVDAFKDAVSKGATVLDTRKADDYEKGFIPGSINIGLNGQFAVWVGTLIDIRKPLVLVTEAGKEEESVLRLARVGYENVIGFLEGNVTAWKEPLGKVKSITAEEMKNEMSKGIEVLDVRKPGEWNVSHVKGATFLPLADFPAILKELDKTKRYIVHCGGGYRSMTAISIMLNHGFTNLLNVYGGFGAMQKAGLPLVSEAVEA